MHKIMNGLIHKFKESNRYEHFLGGAFCGFFLTIIGAICFAIVIELKVKLYGYSWDWWDFAFTLAGGILGNGIVLLVIWLT